MLLKTAKLVLSRADRPRTSNPTSQVTLRIQVVSAFLLLILQLSAGVSLGQVSTQPTSGGSSTNATGRQTDHPSAKPDTAKTGKPSSTTNIDSAQVRAEHAVADPSSLPPTVPAGRPAIGVALEGGGALGLAHIGVLKWMEENRIPIDRISGTSIGALMGALYASGQTPANLERLAINTEFSTLFYIRSPYDEISFRRREDEHEFPQVFTLGLKGGPSLRNAVISDNAINDFLNNNFSRYNSEAVDFDKFPIPFRCVATDLTTMQKVVFRGGPIPLAVRASLSIPGLFAPVEYHDHFFVDGSVMDNLPIDVVRQDLHSDVVIGVHLAGSNFKEDDISSVFGVLSRTFSAGSALNETEAEKQADILVKIDTSRFGTTDYDKAADLIQAGYSAASSNAEALRRYALDQADWDQYIKSRAQRIRPQPALMQVVKVEGSTPGAQASAEYQFQGLEKKPIDAAQIAKAMHRITGNGTDQATFETFQPPGPNPSPVDAINVQEPDTGVRVRLSPERRGPPFLDFGIDATGVTSNVSRGTFDLRLLDTGLGGYGSELRTDVRLGFLTQLSSEYYHQLTNSGYFVSLQGGLLRQPVYLWQNQQRISEHLQQQAGGGVQVGRTFSRYLQTSLEYQAEVVRWHPVTGFDGTAPVSGEAQLATAKVRFDNASSGLSPIANGLRTELRVGSLFDTVSSRNAPLAEFSLKKPFRLNDTQSVYLSFNASSYFRRNVTEPLRFTVGGPLRLSASSVDEYRGTDNYLVRAGYSRKLSALPSGFGQGLYVAGAYEGAEIWSPERHAVLRQDGVLTLIGAFPIGDLTLGGSIGDAGRRKVFITFGRLF